MRVTAGGLCLTGAYVTTVLQDPIPTTGVQSATPASMLGIVLGAEIYVDLLDFSKSRVGHSDVCHGDNLHR